VLLYRGQPWTFRPLAAGALVRQLAGDVLAWNGIVMSIRYLREAGAGSTLKLPRSHAYPELTLQYAAFAGTVAGAYAMWPGSTLRVALLWFVTYITLTQLLQKIRSFAEHALEDADPSLSCSWSPGLLGRLTIWPYNINYHREHHSRPKVPWDRLPAAFPTAEQRPGRDLLAHLWSGASR
jgi:fatty acid desaturase